MNYTQPPEWLVLQQRQTAALESIAESLRVLASPLRQDSGQELDSSLFLANEWRNRKPAA